MRAFPVPAAAIVMATVVACGESTAPVALTGTYTLQTIDGQATPFKSTAGTNMEYYVTGATLTFSGDNAATLTVTARTHQLPPNEQWSDLAPRAVTLTYTRNGNELTIVTSSEVVPSAGIGLTASSTAETVTLRYPIESSFFYDGNRSWLFRRG